MRLPFISVSAASLSMALPPSRPRSSRPSTKGLIGRQVSLADIYRVANAITALYVKHGYAISFAIVPAQKIDEQGVVRIEVVEGYRCQCLFRRRHGALASGGQSLCRKDHRIASAQDIRDRTLAPADQRYSRCLRPQRLRAPENKRAWRDRACDPHCLQTGRGALSFDNRGSRALGPLETDDTVAFNSVLGLGDSLRFHFLQTLNGRN